MPQTVTLRVGSGYEASGWTYLVPSTPFFTALVQDAETGAPVTNAQGVRFYVEFPTLDGRPPTFVSGIPTGNPGEWRVEIEVKYPGLLRVQVVVSIPALQTDLHDIRLLSGIVPAVSPRSVLVLPGGEVLSGDALQYMSAERITELRNAGAAQNDDRFVVVQHDDDGNPYVTTMRLGDFLAASNASIAAAQAADSATSSANSAAAALEAKEGAEDAADAAGDSATAAAQSKGQADAAATLAGQRATAANASAAAAAGSAAEAAETLATFQQEAPAYIDNAVNAAPEVTVSQLTQNDFLAVTAAADLSRIQIRAFAAVLARIYTGTMAVTQPLANHIHQRDTVTGGVFGKGVGTVPIQITASAPVVTLERQVIDFDAPGTLLEDWASAGPPLAAGLSTVNVPLSATLKRVVFRFRANGDDASIVATTVPVMLGEVVLIGDSQSLGVAMMSTRYTGGGQTISDMGLTPSPFGWGFASIANGVQDELQVTYNYPPTAWQQPNDTAGVFTSAFSVEFMNRMIALLGVPVGMIGYAVGGSSQTKWQPGGEHWARLIDVIDRAGGRFGTAISWIGHQNSRDGTTYQSMRDQYGVFFAALDAAYPNTTRKRILSTIPGIGNYSGSTADSVNAIRRAAIDFAASTPASARYVDALDGQLGSDLVHPTQLGNITNARSVFRALGNLFGLVPHDSRGPLITGASRDFGSRWIYLAASQVNGGTAWVGAGTPANQFLIYPAGTSTTPLALDATTPIDLSNPARIGLQLAAAPTEPAGFDVWYRRRPDTAFTIGSAIYDNVTDGDGITNGRQLAIITEPLRLERPQTVLTVAAVSDKAPGQAIPLSGTYTNGLPTSLAYSVDDGATFTGFSPAATIAGGNWSASIPGGVPVGAWRIIVRDADTLGAVTTNPFKVAVVSPIAVPVVASPVLAFDMSAPWDSAFSDTGRAVQASMGQAVAGLADTSGAGNHMLQDAEAARPMLLASVKNSLPGLRFTGSLSQFLTMAAPGGILDALKEAQEFTALVVWTPASLPAAAQDVITFGQSSLTGFNTVRFSQHLSSGAVRAGRHSDTVLGNTPGANVSLNSVVTQVVRLSADGTLRSAVNAVPETVRTATSLGVGPLDFGSLGASMNRNPDKYYLNGWVYEVRIWLAGSDAAKRDQLLSYGPSKWGA